MGFVTTIDNLNGHDDIALALGNMIVANAHDIRHHTQAVIARTKALRDSLFPPVP